jgi:hypothetical protein
VEKQQNSGAAASEAAEANIVDGLYWPGLTWDLTSLGSDKAITV